MSILTHPRDRLKGSVSGGGIYVKGSQVTIEAKAKGDYKFKEWSDGNLDNPRVITLTNDVVYIAYFEKNRNIEHEYVDLGLSVKWATCNVGAVKPDDMGDFFAWGETSPKEYYDWSTYKYGTDYNQLTKYCNNSDYGKNGFIDNKIVLDPEDDAATVNWGEEWRMPTSDELSELFNQCTWSKETWGYTVIGPNGNSIFLPATGYMDKSSLKGGLSYGRYRSSSLFDDRPDISCSIHFSYLYMVWDSRYYGYSVRPVYANSSVPKKKYIISVYTIEDSYGTVSGGGTYDEGSQVTITAIANLGYKFKEWNDGNTDNPRVITVTKDAIYTAHFEEEKNLNAGHEYVDLGLSVKWATCNVGATTPEGYGDYFAWGEVEPKEYYDWSTYKYCDGTMNTLTKYCSKSSYGKDGFTDNKIVLVPEDDAATSNWGGAWRMPTDAEMTELQKQCTWRETTQNGVKGCKVTGPNGNSIFLPAAGYMDGGTLYNSEACYYWSSSFDSRWPYDAYLLRKHMSIDRISSYRNQGLSIRPVCQ